MKATIQTFLVLATISTLGCTNKGSDGGGAPPPTPVVPGPYYQGVNGYDPNQIMTYNYQGMNNGVACTTGQHSLKFSEYCAILQDEAQNNSCALDQRQLAYNTNCVSNSAGSGQYIMPSGTAGFCQIKGVDDNVDPSNLTLNTLSMPQQNNSQGSYQNTVQANFGNNAWSAQSFIPWNGNSAQSFNLTSPGLFEQRYGRATLTMIPSTTGFGYGAIAELNVVLRSGGKYRTSLNFNSRVTFEVGTYSENRKVVIDCVPNSTFLTALPTTNSGISQGGISNSGGTAANLNTSRIICETDRARPQEIQWDRAGLRSMRLKTRDAREVKLDLIPASNGGEEMMQISAEQIDGDYDMLAKSAVRSGLEVNYKDRSTGTRLTVHCSAASF